jgi:hypothetical protein
MLGIWMVGGAPTWLLGWVPFLALRAGLLLAEAGLLRMKLLTVGLIWQFLWTMIILYQEEGNIRLSTIRHRFWLNHPVSARTGKTKKTLWWWIIPLILLVAFLEVGLQPAVIKLWTTIFPFFAEPKGNDMSEMCPMGWSLEPIWIVLCVVAIQQFPRRGILIPRRASTQDARRVWQMGLGGEWCALWVLSSSYALEYLVEYFIWLGNGIHR